MTQNQSTAPIFNTSSTSLMGPPLQYKHTTKAPAGAPMESTNSKGRAILQGGPMTVLVIPIPLRIGPPARLAWAYPTPPVGVVGPWM